jgi:tetratricopeptide (TPR) repeat protein
MTENSDSEPSSSNKKFRKRGIKASRSKLEAATLKAGFNSKMELARAIADYENIDKDKAPIDMVRKVFSGRSVEPKTIERIARVLDVDAFTLYLNEEEAALSNGANEQITKSAKVYADGQDSTKLAQEQDQPSQKTMLSPSTSTHSKYRRSALWLSVASIVVVISFLVFTSADWSNNKQSQINNVTLPKTIAVTSKNVELAETLTQKFVQTMPEAISIKVADTNLISDIIKPWDAPESLRVDYALHISHETKGRYIAVYFHLYEKDSRQLIYADVMPTRDLNYTLDSTFLTIKSSLEYALKISDSELAWQNHELNQENISQLQDALVLLDEATLAEFIDPASTMLYRILRQAPSYTPVNAYICLALTRSYIVARDPLLLDDAEIECASAGNDVIALFAKGELLRRQDKLDLAEETYLEALRLNETNVNSLLGLAETYLAKGLSTRDVDYFKKALELSKKADKVSPYYWKSSFTTSRIYYMMGNATEAITALEKSAGISPNFNNLTNLATAHFCFGSQEKALTAYEKVIQVNASVPLAHYSLSSIYSYFERYADAAIALERYFELLEKQNGQPQLEALIGAGDIYRLKKQFEAANSFYMRAKKRLEQQIFAGASANELEVKDEYITLMLQLLKTSDNLPTSTRKKFIDRFYQLEQNATTPEDVITIMFSYFALNETDSTLRLYQKVAPMCKGFADFPVLKALTTKALSANQS